MCPVASSIVFVSFEPTKLGERLALGGRHERVLAGQKVQHRAFDPPQIDHPPPTCMRFCTSRFCW